MRHLRFALILALLMLTSSSAWAKKVTLAWKPIKGAVQYELVIEKEGKKKKEVPVELPVPYDKIEKTVVKISF